MYPLYLLTYFNLRHFYKDAETYKMLKTINAPNYKNCGCLGWGAKNKGNYSFQTIFIMNKNLKVSSFFPQKANKSSKGFGSKKDVFEYWDDNTIMDFLLIIQVFVFPVARDHSKAHGLLTNLSLPIFFSAQQRRWP